MRSWNVCWLACFDSHRFITDTGKPLMMGLFVAVEPLAHLLYGFAYVRLPSSGLGELSLCLILHVLGLDAHISPSLLISGSLSPFCSFLLMHG